MKNYKTLSIKIDNQNAFNLIVTQFYDKFKDIVSKITEEKIDPIEETWI